MTITAAPTPVLKDAQEKKNNIWILLPFPTVLPLPLIKAGMQSARDVCFSCLSFLRWQNALFWPRTGLY